MPIENDISLIQSMLETKTHGFQNIVCLLRL